MNMQIPYISRLWLLLLLPTLLLIPTLHFNWHNIEIDVANNVNNALAQSEPWAKAETFNRGRDVLLVGTAPSQRAALDATTTALSASGIRQVEFVGEIAPADPPSLKISRRAGKILLEGTLADQANVESLLNQASKQFGADHVVNSVNIGENTQELTAGAELLTVVKRLPESVTLNITENVLTLSGSVETRTAKNSLGDELSAIYKGKIDNHLVIVPQLVERDICQELLDQLLADAKINFASGEATIQEDSFQLIQSIADTANRCPAAEFEIAGYTDSNGTLSYNMALSQRRADSVMEAVVALGLDSSRFTAKGYGPDTAGADNQTASGRAKNRRIEFRLNN
jgi:outer membrane protein OmpA-like peptidoglycan-associated protein